MGAPPNHMVIRQYFPVLRMCVCLGMSSMQETRPQNAEHIGNIARLIVQRLAWAGPSKVSLDSVAKTFRPCSITGATSGLALPSSKAALANLQPECLNTTEYMKAGRQSWEARTVCHACSSYWCSAGGGQQARPVGMLCTALAEVVWLGQ